MGKLAIPQDIINIIKEFIPKDKLMCSPSAECLQPFIYFYNPENGRFNGTVYETESFIEYVLRLNQAENHFLQRHGILFSEAPDHVSWYIIFISL